MAGDRPADLFSADQALAAASAVNLDPRQGTLDGFELPAEAFASQAERGALGGAGPAMRDPVPSEPAKAQGDLGAGPMADVHKDPAPPASGLGDAVSVDEARPRAGGAASLPPAGFSDALAQAVTELQAALADERRAAHESRRRMTRLVSMAILLLLIVLVLGVAQAVVSVRASRESAAAQEKVEALLHTQQTELAALSGAVSLSAKQAALPAGTAPSQPPAVKRAPRISHAHRAHVKARSSTASDPVLMHSPPQAAPWPMGTGSTTAAAL